MEITEKIKSFEDACKELDLNPDNLPVVDNISEKDKKSIIAYYKLIIIIRALNQGWEPDFENSREDKFYNWFYVNSAGFVFASSYSAPSTATASFGSRLCFKNYDLARYARGQFEYLYKDYLLIN